MKILPIEKQRQKSSFPLEAKVKSKRYRAMVGMKGYKKSNTFALNHISDGGM